MLRILNDLLAWIRALAQHWRGARALAGWNDHELADIGLGRAEMPSAQRAGWGNPPKTSRAICCGFRGDSIPQGCR
jgi:uncharacterized protein YjiS (DUF1127 family)